MNRRKAKETGVVAFDLWRKLPKPYRRNFETYPDGSYYVFPYKRFRRFVRELDRRLRRSPTMEDVVRALTPNVREKVKGGKR